MFKNKLFKSYKFRIYLVWWFSIWFRFISLLFFDSQSKPAHLWRWLCVFYQKMVVNCGRFNFIQFAIKSNCRNASRNRNFLLIRLCNFECLAESAKKKLKEKEINLINPIRYFRAREKKNPTDLSVYNQFY